MLRGAKHASESCRLCQASCRNARRSLRNKTHAAARGQSADVIRRCEPILHDPPRARCRPQQAGLLLSCCKSARAYSVCWFVIQCSHTVFYLQAICLRDLRAAAEHLVEHRSVCRTSTKAGRFSTRRLQGDVVTSNRRNGLVLCGDSSIAIPCFATSC